jgi:ribosomal protein L20A (L18A)
VKNYAITVRYNSRTGIHNMYKEYRDTNLNSAVEQMYKEMAGRHRAARTNIQILTTSVIPASAARRAHVQQFHVCFFLVCLWQVNLCIGVGREHQVPVGPPPPSRCSQAVQGHFPPGPCIHFLLNALTFTIKNNSNKLFVSWLYIQTVDFLWRFIFALHVPLSYSIGDRPRHTHHSATQTKTWRSYLLLRSGWVTDEHWRLHTPMRKYPLTRPYRPMQLVVRQRTALQLPHAYS